MHARSEERLNFPSWQKLCISQKGPRRSLENSQEGGLETLAARRIPMETQEGLFKTVCDRKKNQLRAETKLKGFLTEGTWCLLLILDDRKEAESKMFDWFHFQGVPYHFFFFQ